MMTFRRRVMGQELYPRHAAVIVGAEEASSFSGQRLEANKTVRAEEKGVCGGMQRDRRTRLFAFRYPGRFECAFKSPHFCALLCHKGPALWLEERAWCLVRVSGASCFVFPFPSSLARPGLLFLSWGSTVPTLRLGGLKHGRRRKGPPRWG